MLFSSLASSAQDGLLPLDAEKKVLYLDSGKPELSKDEIYKKVQEWVGSIFGNYENAVTADNAEIGKLLITSYVPVSNAMYEYIRFDLTIECQDKQYTARITQLDGISTVRSPARLDAKENDMIAAKEITVKTETNRKKKEAAEDALKVAKADNERINTAMFKVLASLKMFVIPEKSN
jgi:hypothetical protein